MLKLTRHETAVVVLYRLAPVDLRSRIDWELFSAWTRFPASIDPDDPRTARHHVAVQQLHAEHLVGRALARFVRFWTRHRALPAHEEGGDQ